MGVGHYDEASTAVEAQRLGSMRQRGTQLGRPKAAIAPRPVLRLDEQVGTVGEFAVDVLEAFGRELGDCQRCPGGGEEVGRHGQLVTDTGDICRSGAYPLPELVEIDGRSLLALGRRDRQPPPLRLRLLRHDVLQDLALPIARASQLTFLPLARPVEP
jgi:hypothetical protein